MTTTIIAQLTSTIIATILISKRRVKILYNFELYKKNPQDVFLQNNFNYFIAIIRSNRILFSNDQMTRRRGRVILYLFFAQTNCNCIQCSKSDKKSSLDGGRKIAAGTGAIATLPSSSSSYRLISIETPFCNWRPAAAASHPE